MSAASRLPRRALLPLIAVLALLYAAPARAVQFTFGTTTVGTSNNPLDANAKAVNLLTSPKAGTIVNIQGYLDGLGAGSGSQKIKAVVYTLVNGTPTGLLGASNEVTINAGQHAGWVTFTFPGAVSIPSGPVGIGYIRGGPTTRLARAFMDTAVGTRKANSDTYSDGPANPFGTVTTTVNSLFAIKVTADDGFPPLADRVGVNTPNVITEGWNLLYSQTILADDGIHLFRDSPGPLNIWPSSGGTPDWSNTDKLVAFVKNISGGQLLPVMTFSNPWQHPSCTATPSWQCAPDPAYYQEWSDEVVAVMDHLVAQGIAVPEIEYWNEPWCCSFWLPQSNPSAYVALLRVLSTTVWARYPAAKILVSADYWQQGSTCSASPCPEWFSLVLQADTTNLINDPRIVLTTHNYAGSSSPATDRGTGWSFDRYKLAHDQAVAHGKSSPHVEITEYGWEADTGCVVFNDGVPEATQSQYTVDGARQAFATGYVDKVFIFDEYRGANTGCTGTQFAYNMHRADGTARPMAGAVKTYIAAGIP